MRGIIGLLCLGLLVMAPAEGQARGVIAFVRGDGQNEDIWLVAEDGSRLRQLTSDPGRDQWPAWSSNSDQIVFVSDREGYSDLWIMDADGSRQRQLTFGDTPPASHPSWRGDRIVFQAGDSGIWLVRPDGTGLMEFGVFRDAPMLAIQPVWSPRVEILVTRYLPPEHQVEMFVSGISFYSFGSDVIVTNSWEYEIWNLNTGMRRGENTYCFDSGGDIWVQEFPGGFPSARINITNTPDVIDEDPTWSPDGERIAFVSAGWITVGDPDTGVFERVVDGEQPAWSPGELPTNVSPATWGVVKTEPDVAH